MFHADSTNFADEAAVLAALITTEDNTMSSNLTPIQIQLFNHITTPLNDGSVFTGSEASALSTGLTSDAQTVAAQSWSGTSAATGLSLGCVALGNLQQSANSDPMVIIGPMSDSSSETFSLYNGNLKLPSLYEHNRRPTL